MSLPTNFFIGRGGKASVLNFYPEDFNLANATRLQSYNFSGISGNIVSNPYGIWYNPNTSRIGISKANGNATYTGREVIALNSSGMPISATATGAIWDGNQTQYTGMTHAFSPDGTVFISMSYQGFIKTWNLSTPFDITTETLRSEWSPGVNEPPGQSGIVSNAYGCNFSSDGLHLLTGGRNQATNAYVVTMTTPYDFSTIVNNTASSYWSHNDANITPMGWHWNADGTQFLIVNGDASTDNVRQYNCTTPYDISSSNISLAATLTYGGFNRITEVTFNTEQGLMYLLDNSAETVHIYSI